MYSLIPSLRTVTCTDTQLPFHAFQTPVRVIPRGLKEGGREACRASGNRLLSKAVPMPRR